MNIKFLIFYTTLMTIGQGICINQKKLDKRLSEAVWDAHRADSKDSKSEFNNALGTIQSLINQGAHAQSSFTSTMLDAAIYAENPKLLEILLKNGAEPNQMIFDDPLLFLVCSRHNPDMLKIALKNGANPNQRFEGITPLMYSAIDHHHIHPDLYLTKNKLWDSHRKWQKTAIVVLVKNGADINAQTGKAAKEEWDLEAGCTVLDCVQSYGDKELASLLKSLGARSSKQCKLSKK